jgi:hypothetical protein
MTRSTRLRRRNAIVAAVAAGLVLPFTALAPRSASAAGIAQVQQGTEQSSTTGHLLATMSSASSAGNLLVVTLADTPNLASAGPSGWALAKGVGSASAGRQEIWYYSNAPSGITSATFTFSACNTCGYGSWGQMTEWSGAATTGVLDQGGTTSASSSLTATASTAGSTVVSGELGATVFGTSASESTFTAGSGWTHLYTDPANGRVSDYHLGLPIGIASEIETASATSATWAGVIATFEPVGVPGPVTGLSASPGSDQATVSWTAPSTGGAVVTYVITALSGGVTARNTTAVPAASTSVTMTGLAGGTVYKFSVYGTNAAGNGTTTTTASTVTVAGGAHPYTASVLSDSPTFYYRLDETSGTTAWDSSGTSDGTEVGAPTQGSAGLLTTDADTGLGLNGSTQYEYGNTSYVNPTTFTIEAWFKTSATTGGRIVGFGSAQIGNSGTYDRQIYMSNAGQVYFGVYPSAVKTINSAAAYNNGAAHHVVATLSGAGMFLYVDGGQVASDSTTTGAQSYTGYWRAGEDNLAGWTNAPTSNFFNGTIDDVAVYPTALSLQQVQVHYCEGANVSCLSMVASTTVAFSATTLNGLDQTKTVTATFDVTDNTGGNGWNVTATSTTFTTGPHPLPTGATTVSLAPTSACDTGFTCTAPTDSVSYPYALPAGASAPAATKLVNAAVNSGIGHETITATFTLTVPGNAYAGTYQSTWTFSLVSGP